MRKPCCMMMIVDCLNHLLTERGLAPVTGKTAERFEKYADMLLQKNRVLNLTAIEDPAVIAVRHFADSLMIFKAANPSGKMIDIGCGGGFPGIPVKLYADMMGLELHLVMMDATAKKIAFVGEAANALELDDVKVIAGRAEEEIKKLGRESFDIATARAVADMRVIAELALPYLKTGGNFFAWKTEKAAEEVAAAEETVKLLGGVYAEKIPYGSFYVLRCEKVGVTPPKYPRRYAQIIKSKP